MHREKAYPKPHHRIWLREWRKHRGRSQEWVAEHCETTKATISRIENGKTPYSQGILELLAAALDCEPVDFLLGPPTANGLSLHRVINRLPPHFQAEVAAYVAGLTKRIAA